MRERKVAKVTACHLLFPPSCLRRFLANRGKGKKGKFAWFLCGWCLCTYNNTVPHALLSMRFSSKCNLMAPLKSFSKVACMWIDHLGQAGALIRWACCMKMVDSYMSLSTVCIHFILSLSSEGTSWRKEWHVILPKLFKLISFPNCLVLVIFCFLSLAGFQLWVEWVYLLDGGFLPVCYPENFRFKTQYVEASLCLIWVSLLWLGLPKKGYYLVALRTWSWLYFASSIFHTQWLLLLFPIKLSMPFNPAVFTSHA